MSINKKIIVATAIGLALGASSCRKLLNVNTNPNVSQTATVETLLPAAQLYVGSSIGMDLQVVGSIWSQYWTQTPVASQYISLEQYAPGQDAFSYAWSNLYSGAENFYQLGKLADTQHKRNYKAIALLMQAYTFQVITDAFGDAPFRQALQGQYSDGHIINPKYDSQMVVYNGIIAYIDTAINIINEGNTVTPGTDDLIYGGDMSLWAKFANTLKLKVLLRRAEKDPAGTQAAIDSFYATSPVFIGTGEDAKISYGSSTANKNPLYAEESSTVLANIQNLAGSNTCIDTMNSNGDPRAYLFYEYLPTTGTVVGIPQGQYNIKALSGTYSLPSTYVAGDCSSVNAENSKDAPVNLLTSWESYFMQAEVVARGWAGAPGDDDALFYSGIQASFDYAFYSNALNNEYGTAGTTTIYNDYISGYLTGTPGYWTVYPSTGTSAEKLRFIITQKWFAMCGNQGFEAWTEWRRTGYPDFFVIPPFSLMGTNRPVRLLYPTSESTTNVNFPGLAPLTQKVWWDIL